MIYYEKEGEMKMDMMTFEYLYYKVRGASKEEIMAQAKINEAEYDFMESNFEDVLQNIYKDRDKAQDIGSEFVKLTRYIYGNNSDQQQGIPRPDVIKNIPGESFALPAVGTLNKPNISLYDAISNRRSTREYSQEALSMEELSFLLWAGFWAKEFKSSERYQFTIRNLPSAGARHPFECYLMINRVHGLKAGLYHYHPIKHMLVRLEKGEDIAMKVYDASMRQEMVKSSAVSFIVSANPYRTTWRYGQRGYRYIYMDAGHVGQNISLACEAIDAGACMIAAFQDEAMNDIIEANGKDEFVIYVFSVGKKAKKSEE